MQAVLYDNKHQRGIELEVTPLFLLPDTNCYIDRLSDIMTLVKCMKYTIIVPLMGKKASMLVYILLFRNGRQTSCS